MSRVIGYARVSTDEQGRSGLGLEVQGATILRAFPAAEMVTEVASAATLRKRPLIREVLGGMRKGDVLVVAKLDRLARSMIDFASILDRSRRGRWSLVALDVGIDTTTVNGRLVAHVLMGVAEWEHDMIAERTQAATLAKLGKDPDWVGRQEQIRSLRDGGLSQRAIAAELGLGKETVARALRRAG